MTISRFVIPTTRVVFVSCLALLLSVATFPYPLVLNGQSVTPPGPWELGVAVYGVRAGGDAFHGAGGGAATTASLGYRLTPRFDVRTGVTVMAIDPNLQELIHGDGAGIGIPWLPDTNDEYVSVFLASSFSPGPDGSRLAPFVGGKLTFVRQTRDDTQTGWGIGAATGVRWKFASAVGMEILVDVSFVNLRGERTVYLGPFLTAPRYRPTKKHTWEAGYSAMVGVGLVLGL